MLEEELKEITQELKDQNKFHSKLAGKVKDPKILEIQYLRRQK